MANLIVGHASASETRIWVRGDHDRPHAWLRLGEGPLISLRLEDRHYYTSVFILADLSPGETYHCRLWLTISASPPAATDPHVEQARFRTAPDTMQSFRFLFGSCNGPSFWGATHPDRMWETVDGLASSDQMAFMLHCGDQIYADMPPALNDRSYDLPHYRDKYVEAWDREPARRVFRRMPHYMILDDHEVINDYAADMDLEDVPINYLSAMALKAYREFQHIKNPQTFGSQPLYYTFAWAHVRFFVLDTRSERIRSADQIVGPEQMERLKSWLLDAPADAPKFVVSSVPFVTETKLSPEDKWTGFSQRQELMEFFFEHKLRNVFFLTGDMHSACHSELVISNGQDEVRVRELMSSPLNQLLKAGRSRFRDGVNWSNTPNGLRYRSTIDEESFYSKHSLVSEVKVSARSLTLTYHRTKSSSDAEVGPFVLPFDAL